MFRLLDSAVGLTELLLGSRWLRIGSLRIVIGFGFANLASSVSSVVGYQ